MFDLLPENFQSVQAVKQLEKEFGGIGFLVVTVQSNEEASFEKLRPFVDVLALRIGALPEVRYVDVRKPSGFFYERRFLYVPLEELKKVEQYVNKAVSLYEDGKEVKEPLEKIQALREKYKFSPPVPEELYHYNKEEEMFVLLVKPFFRASEISKARGLLEKIDEIVSGLNTKQKLTVGYTGRYAKRVEMDRFLQKEIGRVSVVAYFTVFILFVIFRRPIALAAVALSIIVSVIWMFGAARLSIGSINMITGFGTAILIGMGMDYAIYLMNGYQRLRAEGMEHVHAFIKIFTGTSRAIFSGCLTSILAFLTLLPSQFKGFSEFGIVGALGLILNFIAIHTALPSLICLWESKIVFREKLPFRLLERLRFSRARRAFDWVLRQNPSLLLAVVGLCAISGLMISFPLSFEYNFQKLEGSSLPSYQLEKKVERIFGQSLTPAIVLTSKPSEEAAWMNAVEKRKSEGKTFFKNVQTLSSFVPQDQGEKKILLRRILDQLELLPLEGFPDFISEVAGVITSIVPGDIEWEDLPEEVQQKFSVSENSKLRAIHIFSKVNEDDIREAKTFVSELEQLEKREKISPAASDIMILADIAKALERDLPRVVAGLFLILLVIFWIETKSIFGSFLLMSPLLFGSFLLFGFMWVFGISFNIINILILPILLGLGMDNVIHLFHTWKEDPHALLADGIWHIFPSLSMGALTAAVGFGSLAVARHPGIASFGILAVIGVITMYLTAWLMTPALIRLYGSKLR